MKTQKGGIIEYKMKYERLLEIAVSFAEVSKSVPECDDELWRRVRELKMTLHEMQEVGLQRYEIFPYSDNPEDDNNDKIVIWDNLISDDVEGLAFKSRKEAMEKIEWLMKKDLDQEEGNGDYH